jgi:hypothetical protein
MSALEELWLWLQGRNSQTEAGPDTTDTTSVDRKPEPAKDDPVVTHKDADNEARIQRNWRYRAGPWQMK